MKKITIIGSGNIGLSLAKGLVKADFAQAADITLTRRNIDHLKAYQEAGFNISNDNKASVEAADIVILAVLPQQLNAVLDEINTSIVAAKHLVISVISGVSCAAVKEKLGNEVEFAEEGPKRPGWGGLKAPKEAFWIAWLMEFTHGVGGNEKAGPAEPANCCCFLHFCISGNCVSFS